MFDEYMITNKISLFFIFGGGWVWWSW